MQIGIQGWYLNQPYTGIGQHTRGLLKGLAKQKKVTCLVPTPHKVRIAGVPNKWVKHLPTKAWIPTQALKKWVWERIQVPQFFADKNPDWELYPYPSPLPQSSPNLRAMTVHDLILWQDKRYQSKGLKGLLKNLYHERTRLALVDVDQVFTVSETTKNELNVPSAQVLYNAAPEWKKSHGTKSHTARSKPAAKAPYLVYLGGYDIRKQVPQLIQAFKKVRQKFPQMQLHLVGKAHHQSRFYPVLPQVEGVKYLGTLATQQIYEVLQNAFAFAHFSDAEGFNLPLLQAMLTGTPAVVRDLPVNREVSKGSALFLKSPEKELLATIESLQKDAKRQAVIKKQKQAARSYSWEKSAKQLLKTLKHASP